MWTRVELKTRAKANLRRYYWTAFFISLIFSVISSFGSINLNLGESSSSGGVYGYTAGAGGTSGLLGQIPETVGRIPVSGTGGLNFSGLLMGFLAGFFIFFAILAVVLSVFVIPVAEVGKNRFYMESRGMDRPSRMGTLFWGFTHNYLNIVLTMLLKNIFVILGTFLCVIPGIYLSYCYYMVPYILAENPDMRPMEALQLSKDMMNGHKLNTFVLQLSFIGWWILGALLCCIGTWFVQPYYEATFAELYAVLRSPYNGRLSGFGYQEGMFFGGNGFYGGFSDNGSGSHGTWNAYAGGQNQSAGSWNAGQNQNAGNWNAGQDSGYGQENPGTGYTAGQENGGDAGWQKEPDRHEVTRAEGGPGKGYYLNGEFHPYTEDENS